MAKHRAIPKGYMTVGEVAKKIGVTVRTLQYYDKEGLLSPSAESEGGRRLYTDKDLVILHQIISLKSLGFSLDDIKHRLISLETPTDVANALTEQADSIRESHDMAEVENLCDRIAILNNGNIAFCGTATELTDTIGEKYFIHIKTKQGNSTFETENIEDTLISLLNDLNQKGVHILDIKVDRGTLEQHFIEMARRETE